MGSQLVADVAQIWGRALVFPPPRFNGGEAVLMDARMLVMIRELGPREIIALRLQHYD